MEGCTDANACNYNADATQDDGSCDFCGDGCESGGGESVAYSLTVESSSPVAAAGTTYRFYVNMTDASDRMSAVFGNDELNLMISTPDGAYNNAFNSSWSAAGINPAFLPMFPDMADDTYATIGLDGPASTSGIEGAADPSLVEDVNQAISPYFLTNGAESLLASTNVGASWYVLNTAGNGLPDADMRVLVLQVTTTGAISGTLSYQVFPLGVGEDDVLISLDFDGAGTFGGSSGTVNACGCMNPDASNYDSDADYDDGSCIDIVLGCIDEYACNYDADANTDDGSCLEDDECGVCGGSGISEGACDCAGKVLDDLSYTHLTLNTKDQFYISVIEL